jgi:hypothetical protein
MSTLPANIQSLITSLEVAQTATPSASSGDFQYLNLTKQGEWLYGADEIEVSDDSAFVIDPSSYAQGYVAWSKDNDLLGEEMATAGQPPVLLSALDNSLPWKAQVGFALKGIEGAEDGEQLLFKTSSQGGKEAISALLAKILAKAKAGESAYCPVVLLDSSNYKHKKWGKIFKPVLTVDEWVEVPTGDGEEEAAPPVKEKPKKAIAPPAKKTRTRKPAPEPEVDSGEGEWESPEMEDDAMAEAEAAKFEADETQRLAELANALEAGKAAEAAAAKTPRTRRTRKTG